MKKDQKSMLVLGIVTAFTVTVLFLPGLVHAGDFKPPGPPWSTMKILNEIPPTWSQIVDASDGEGDGCNSSRFECVMDDYAVLDKETGLIWARNANLMGKGNNVLWQDAINYCSKLSLGDRKGWRLPTREELASLLDMSSSGFLLLPSGHPFDNVEPSSISYSYWSSTVYESDPNYAWRVNMVEGDVIEVVKLYSFFYVWPVRGGN